MGEREALLRESKTSLHKAVKIGGDDDTIAHLRKLAKTAKRYGLDLGRFRIPKRVKPESDCSDTLLRIEVTNDAREDGRIGPELHQQALKALAECGVVVLENAFPPEAIDRVLEAQTRDFNDFTANLASTDASDTNTANSNKRSHARYEIKARLEPPYTEMDMIRPPFVIALARHATKEAYLEVDTFSHVTSQSRSLVQGWHRDAAPLFATAGGGDSMRLPPHGLVMFVPLVDCPLELGPTEYLLKSHIPCKEKKVAIKGHKFQGSQLVECPHSAAPGMMWSATARRGAAVLFDLRILHRGGANRSDQDRPMLYTSYVVQWWRDSVNFDGKQTSEFQRFDAPAKQLLRRIDHEEYVAELERLLGLKGVDVAALQSTYRSEEAWDVHDRD